MQACWGFQPEDFGLLAARSKTQMHQFLAKAAAMIVQKRFFGGSFVGNAWSRFTGWLPGANNGDEEGDGGATSGEEKGFSPVDQVPAEQSISLNLS